MGAGGFAGCHDSMNTLDRYIGLEFAKTLALVLLLLLPLFSFLDLIQQLDDVGTGSYGLVDAFSFEARMLPRRGVDLLPFAALMACTIALALLGQNSELIALQASGISVARIALAVLKSGVLLVLLAAALDEVVVSPLHQYAVQQRSLAISDSKVLQREKGFWIHYGNRFVSISDIRNGLNSLVPTDIDIFELDEERRLRIYIHAQEADITDPGRWRLRDALVKRLENDRLVTQQVAEMPWESRLSSDEVRLLELPPNVMSPSQVYRYLRYLRENGQSADRYELAFWQKITLPLAIGAMLLLAIPFAFGSPRSIGTGRRIIYALASGAAFQIVVQIAANVGLIWELSAPVTILSPVVIAFAVALLLLRRVRS